MIDQGKAFLIRSFWQIIHLIVETCHLIIDFLYVSDDLASYTDQLPLMMASNETTSLNISSDVKTCKELVKVLNQPT